MENSPIQAEKNRKNKGESESGSLSVALRELSPYMALGWIPAGCTVAGTVGGVYLDRWLGTKPWLTLTGVILGITVGFVAVFQTLATQEAERRKSRED